jgi:chromosome segregation ATPase
VWSEDSGTMSSIVVLKSGTVLDSEVKNTPGAVKGREPVMALTEVQRAHDAAWNCPMVDDGGLHQNGNKLLEEVRRSAELSAGKRRIVRKEGYCPYSSHEVEKENVDAHAAPEHVEEANAKDGSWMSDYCIDVETVAEKTRLDDHGLRNRVWALEEEKGKLHKDLAAMTLKETILRDKVREFELQMDGHRKRVERAERTILELRQAVAQSSKQARQADKEAEELRLICARNDGEKQDMQNRVERLQQLCMNHEKSIHGLRQGLKNGMDGNKEGRMSRLQKELQRLSGVEIGLRTDLEASRVENATLRRDINCLLERFANQQRESTMHMKKLEQELRAEIDRGQAKVAELQDENNILFAKLRLLTRERHDTREALRSCNGRVSDLEEENQSLQEEISRVEKALEAKQMDIQSLESQLERSIQNKEIAQAALALKEKASLNDGVTMKVKDKEPWNAPQSGSTEMRQSLQAAAQQLYSMNERLEKLMDKLSERDLQLQEARADIVGKDEVVAGLEHTLSNLAKTVDSQSSRLMRLSKQNEDLTKVTQSQAGQIEEFQSRIATAVDCRNKLEQELGAARKRLEDHERDFESQGLTCQLLQERVDALEAELQHCQPQITTLLQERDDLVLERENLHHSLADVTLRVTDLEHRLAEREEAVKLQEATLEELRKEVDEGRKELSLVKQERDEMQSEAEAMSREALRTSVEVEVLRRRVHQLDEDVLLRDGQICILRGGLDDS